MIQSILSDHNVPKSESDGDSSEEEFDNEYKKQETNFFSNSKGDDIDRNIFSDSNKRNEHLFSDNLFPIREMFNPEEHFTIDGYDSSEEGSDTVSYIESLTFPTYLLQPLAVNLLFTISASQQFANQRPEKDEQLLTIQKNPVTE